MEAAFLKMMMVMKRMMMIMMMMIMMMVRIIMMMMMMTSGSEGEAAALVLPVVLSVLAISFGSYIHGTSIVFADVSQDPSESHFSYKSKLYDFSVSVIVRLLADPICFN